MSCSGGAQALGENSKNIDIVFVLDTSYSMNQTDKGKISIEILKLFTDISDSVRTRIAFVAYNDTIKKFIPLTEINSDQGKDDLKNNLDSIECSGRTDTGLGLKKAWELLNNTQQDRKKIIVLLTDGEININDLTQQRTVQTSIDDINEVVSQAVAMKIPIYTVGMGYHDFDLSLLQDIATKTGAASYRVGVPEELLDVFANIFANYFNSEIIPLATMECTGGYQEINLKIPLQHGREVNLIALSGAGVEGLQALYNGKESYFYHSKHYDVLKIVNPDQQEVTIGFKGAPHDVVRISTLSYYDLTSEVQVNGQPISGKTVRLGVHLIDPANGVRISDETFYGNFTTKISIKNLQTNEEIIIPSQGTESGWEANYIFPEKGRYLVTAQSESNFCSNIIATLEVRVGDDGWMGKIGIAILIMGLMVMIYYREKKPKVLPAFRGEINVYYHRLRYYEEQEIPAFTILMDAYNPEKNIDLCQILHAVNANQGMKESGKIWFSPGGDDTILLSHRSLCTIMVGQTVIGKNEKYILHSYDKVHIIFPENGGEIELHYKC